eukprot:TRINITY_DN39286_c0_g1_i1.p1 TRINITY_DN39286_c0_g1~~TRINITY_DN39286_c0_g1_i1.p1  ORF type:complete len:407 (-),score=92.95 TRINITY_DN39286_c0_g1_i1:58-1278(-)
MFRCHALRRPLLASAALGSAAASSASNRSRAAPGHAVSCEVRLWGPSGTKGRSAADIAAEATARRTALEVQPLDPEGFARQGPLYAKLLQHASPPLAEDWLRMGAVAVASLTGKACADARPSALEPEVARRVYHLYLPMYFWMRQEVMNIRASRIPSRSGAVTIGLSAPQGWGKTTAMDILRALFAEEGLHFEALSIDDFYLPRSWQEVVADLHSSNPLLQVRGNAGTHEVGLGTETLKALKQADEGEVPLPCYNKSACRGRGDRFPSACWERARTPCDVVVLEGWMLGFKPIGSSKAASEIHPGLPTVDEKLQEYQAWDDLLDCFCVVGLEDVDQVYKWRLQAEKARTTHGGQGMSEEELKSFVSVYMPAYTAYRECLYDAAAGAGVDGKPSLVFFSGDDRMPCS